MLTEGQLSITLQSSAEGNSRVSITSTRPTRVAQLLLGKSAEQALELIPRIFSLCSMAQSRAASLAIHNQLNEAAEPFTEAARDSLVLVETAREHLLQLMMKTPQITKQPVNPASLSGIATLVQQWQILLFGKNPAFSLATIAEPTTGAIEQAVVELELLLQQRIYHCSPGEWLTISTPGDLLHWARRHPGVAADITATIHDKQWAQAGDTTCNPMPELDHDQLENLLSNNEACFASGPTWHNRPLETTCLSRNRDNPLISALTQQFGSGLLARWTARLVDLARIPGQLRQLATGDGNRFSSCHRGVAQVEAARGRLIHRARLNGRQITEYQIVAPTEWNFHPDGVVSQSLCRLKTGSREALDYLARLLINSIDPCVGYQLRFI